MRKFHAETIIKMKEMRDSGISMNVIGYKVGASASDVLATIGRQNLPSFLYRCFSRNHELLYIGCSISPFLRFNAGHRARKPWWHKVCMITLERYSNKSAALKAERLAIGIEFPKYNLQSIPKKSQIQIATRGKLRADK